jgi:hypothetical protein
MDYFAFALSGTENIRYQYRLAGADETWSEPNLSRTTLYSNLRPGSYAFQVRCLNPLPGDPATVRFTVLPHIWERWWFVSLAAMAFLGALYGAHSYRLANILAMQNMRTRLARDLHDDIGSGLSKIVILSEVARRGNGGGPVPEALDHIADTSREVLDAVGDLVWATNATAARIEDLIPRMRSFASQLFEAQGVEFELRVSGTPFGKPLSPEALRQAPLQNGDAFDARHPGQPDIDQGDARRGRFDCRNGLFHRRVQGRDGEPGSAADQYGETLADFADIFDDGNL